jgi:hypothetical protein
MSQENVDVSRRATEAFNRRDFDAWLADLHPEIVWYGFADEPELGPFRGHRGVLAMVARWTDLLPDLRVEVKEYISVGEYVIGPARMRGHTADALVSERRPILEDGDLRRDRG